MVHFDHPNVMTLTGVILVDGGAPLLVMPFMAKGTLLAYVRDNKTKFLHEDEEKPDKVSSFQFNKYVMCVLGYVCMFTSVYRLSLLQRHYVNFLVKLLLEWSI